MFGQGEPPNSGPRGAPGRRMWGREQERQRVILRVCASPPRAPKRGHGPDSGAGLVPKSHRAQGHMKTRTPT